MLLYSRGSKSVEMAADATKSNANRIWNDFFPVSNHPTTRSRLQACEKKAAVHVRNEGVRTGD